MRVGTSVFNHSDCDVMVAAWIPIDCPPGVVFEQITCGSSCVHVWALDQQGRTYVRTDVDESFPVGKSWKLIEGTSSLSSLIN